jgi:hypothetical protein
MSDLNSILTTKVVCSIISIVACVYIITLYLILLIRNICLTKKDRKESLNKSLKNSILENNDSILSSFQINRTSKRKNKKTRIGLGSHFVFALSLCYLLYAISFFTYMEDKPDKKHDGCGYQALFMNFFDMSAFSWTACIGRVTLLGTYIVDIKKVNRSVFAFFLYSFVPAFSISLGYI